MAILKTYMFQAHHNIYKKVRQPDDTAREVRVETAMPEGGTDEETGILFFISGYGATVDSHVFQKMRKEFCDQYHVITAQCDYFGSKYLKPELNELIKLVHSLGRLPEPEKETTGYRNEISESEDEFNDMGMMQALDCVDALLGLIYELKAQDVSFNTKKIILFGSSHGAYVAHLVNVICPGLVSCIIDISSYLSPFYMNKNRLYLDPELGIKVGVEYFVKSHPQYRYSEKLYDLRFLYQNMENTCKIIAFQGTEDWMVDAKEKEQFISKLQNAELMMIGTEDVDGVLCKSADHGLDMDFFVLFQMMMPLLSNLLRQKSSTIELQNTVFLGGGEDGEPHIRLSYETGLPQLIDISK